MGNCQATGDVVGVSVEHPDGKIERLYWSVTARQVMLQHPGHYVAMVPPQVSPKKGEVFVPPSNKLKLLPPHGTLQIGYQYRLVSFEDVLLELTNKKRFGRSSSVGTKSKRVYTDHSNQFAVTEDDEDELLKSDTEGDGDMNYPDESITSCATYSTMRSFSRSGQWRPALQSISELGR